MLRIRWLGRVPYREAWALQRALFERSRDDHLLLLEHPHVYTLGVRAKREHLLVPPASVGADLVATNRGGDVTYHGPGQLVGYPVLSVPGGPGATPRYVEAVEDVVIGALADLGLPEVGRLPGYPGVWVAPEGANPRKICAIGVRLTRGRSMHGFALNVAPDLSYFDHIVPCGIADKTVTSLAAEGVDATMAQVVDAIVARAALRWAPGGWERQDVAWRSVPSDLSAFTRGETVPSVTSGSGPRCGGGAAPTPGIPTGTTPVDEKRDEPASSATRAQSVSVRLRGRLAEAGVQPDSGLAVDERKPPWLRVKANMGPRYRDLKATMRGLDLVTVCEEAGCPNIFECWADGTATFMINGERCTRACGFCLVDTRHPVGLDTQEPGRVAEAVARLGLAHAVVTAVARDDLPDGGAGAFAATITAVHERCPGTAVEVLIPDCKGSEEALDTVFAAGPEVLNHNLETVARLQRAVRPSASYARSLGVLARAKAAGLVTKSGIILGMGETEDEVRGALADLAAVGVDIVTLGQYLRPTAAHLPVARWWRPEEFDRLRQAGEDLGFAHVEASPLTRSSYHARGAAASAGAALADTNA
ncbi:MAG TPA: lipoyl synthase [Acidimicrobiales bacterium]|nr:lipoyl synthase [Acidimicrobiales bacterium]